MNLSTLLLRRRTMMAIPQDYIQDGLIFLLDCADFNNGQSWVDRIGNIIFNNIGCTKQEDGGVYFGNGNYMFSSNSPQTPSDTETTLEICIKINSYSKSVSTPVFINCTSALFAIEGDHNAVGSTRGDSTTSRVKLLDSTPYAKKSFSCFPYENARMFMNNTPMNTGTRFLFNIRNAQGCFIGNIPALNRANMDAAIYCIRVYNRQITTEERTYNFNIDSQRFGIAHH